MVEKPVVAQSKCVFCVFNKLSRPKKSTISRGRKLELTKNPDGDDVTTRIQATFSKPDADNWPNDTLPNDSWSNYNLSNFNWFDYNWLNEWTFIQLRSNRTSKIGLHK